MVAGLVPVAQPNCESSFPPLILPPTQQTNDDGGDLSRRSVPRRNENLLTRSAREGASSFWVAVVTTRYPIRGDDMSKRANYLLSVSVR